MPFASVPRQQSLHDVVMKAVNKVVGDADMEANHNQNHWKAIQGAIHKEFSYLENETSTDATEIKGAIHKEISFLEHEKPTDATEIQGAIHKKFSFLENEKPTGAAEIQGAIHKEFSFLENETSTDTAENKMDTNNDAFGFFGEDDKVADASSIKDVNNDDKGDAPLPDGWTAQLDTRIGK